MSFAGLKYAITVPRLTGSERLVFIFIADSVNKYNVCFPSQAWLSKKTGLCIRTVRAALLGLEGAGHIERKKRMKDGKRTSDLIHAILPKPAAKSAGRKGQKVPSNPISPYGVDIEEEERAQPRKVIRLAASGGVAL